MRKRFICGLVIGRFQPFHKGHAYLIRQAFSFCETIVIGIGSSNRNNKENPIRFRVRKKILLQFIKAENLQSKVVKIISIPDVPDDDEWLSFTTKKSGPIDVVVGNNDWVNGIFLHHKTKVVEIPYYKRDLLEGKKIRQRMREGELWETRVPKYLLEIIKDAVPWKK